MRDLKIIEEWLVKLRQEKRVALQSSAMAAAAHEDFIHASNRAHEVNLCTIIIDGIRLLETDSGEFVKRHLP